jgi:integrase
MRQAGSIIKKRKRYYIVYRTETGKQKWEGGFDNKGQAQTRLTEVLGQIQKGAYIEPSEKTFGVFADQWLKNRVNIEGATAEGYESYLKMHVKPVIEDMKLKDIRHSHIQELVASLVVKQSARKKPLSARTIGKIATMLKTVFKSAVKNELIRTNPALDVELPKPVKTPIQPPDKQDVLAILQTASIEYQTLFLLDAVTGLRRGEVLALQWGDMDWINGEVRIERAIKKTKSVDGAHKWAWKIGPTKGGRARRVGVPPVVLQALELLRATAKGSADDQFIFTRNDTFIDPEYFTRWIALPVIRKATEGRIRRFHDLRHFFASMLIENGENPKYIQDQVGHASITTTFDTYGHLMPQAKQEASRKLERALFGKKANVRTLLERSPEKQIPETVN